MIKSIWIQSIIALFIAVFSFNVSAIVCNEKSPNLIEEGDKYFDMMGAKPMTKKQKANIKKMFSSLKNKLSGKSVATECEGPESNPRKIIKKEKVSSELSHQSDGGLFIELDIYDIEKKFSYKETLNLFGINDHYTLNMPSKNSLTLIYKWRERRGRAANILNEKIINLSTYKGGLTINIMHYYNGYFAFSKNINLYP